MIVPESRFMHASTADKKTGMSLARKAKMQQSSNEGNWGVYRNRLAASKTDDLMSPYIPASTPKMAHGAVDKLTLQLSNPSGEPKSIRHGRVRLPKGIDNWRGCVNIKAMSA